jgi:predicted dehydrogenase
LKEGDPMSKVRVGVVGVGYLGRFHAEKYRNLPDCELVALVDIVEERVKYHAMQLGTDAYINYRDIYDKVDAVSIVVPTRLHHQVTKDFLRMGIDVLVEKPLAVTFEEAMDLVETARKSGAILQVGHLERFNPAIVSLKERLKNPMFIESHRISPFIERGADVDVVLDLMIHDIDIILDFVKSEIKEIHAVGVPVISPKIDIVNARLIFENGCVANVTASRIAAKSLRKVRIFQPDAYFSVDYSSSQVLMYRKLERGEDNGPPRILMDSLDVERKDPLQEEIRSFIKCVINREKPLVSGEVGARCVEVAQRILSQVENLLLSI